MQKQCGELVLTRIEMVADNAPRSADSVTCKPSSQTGKPASRSELLAPYPTSFLRLSNINLGDPVVAQVVRNPS